LSRFDGRSDGISVTFASSSNEPFKVLIVGGGVAGLEAALALRDLCGERIATTMIASVLAGRDRARNRAGAASRRLQVAGS
jgi:NADPH-dependent 2,4-dienoyl-CoA reductase/sulfur reductase-like enzyme